jgi:hypothetical protein
MTALSELITAANRDGLNHRQIAAQANAAGVRVGTDAVWKVMSGRHGAVKDGTLRAFATVLSIDFADLRAAADLPTADLGPYQPPEDALRLGRREREAIDELIRLLAAPRPQSTLRLVSDKTDVKEIHQSAAHKPREKPPRKAPPP